MAVFSIEIRQGKEGVRASPTKKDHMEETVYGKRQEGRVEILSGRALD